MWKLSSYLFGIVFLFGITSDAHAAKVIRVGIIGLDTSHVVAFTKEMNNPKAKGVLTEVKVVAAYAGGSADLPASRDRVEGFTKKVKEMDVEIVDTIDALLKKVDVVLLESVDGRPHFEQAVPVIKAGKPLFIDKPLAGSLSDCIAIFELAKQHKVPCFSSSSLRFSPGILAMRNHPKVGKVLGCSIYSPCKHEPHHPDLFWYGIHGVEMLYTIMGTGCQTVSRVSTKNADLVTGTWSDSRVATYRGIRKGKATYGGMVYGDKGIAPCGSYAGYVPLLKEIATFFKTGKPPIPMQETIEIYTFMEAADESKRHGGKSVSMKAVLQKATEQANKKLQAYRK